MASGTISKMKWGTPIFPLSADRTSNWSFTAPSFGFLYAGMRSTSRNYIGIKVNGTAIIGYASSDSADNVAYAVPCNAGDVVDFEGLTTNTFLIRALTFFISFE